MKSDIITRVILIVALVLVSVLSLTNTFQWWFNVNQDQKQLVQLYYDARNPQGFTAKMLQMTELSNSPVLTNVLLKTNLKLGYEYPTTVERDVVFEQLSNMSFFIDVPGVDTNNFESYRTIWSSKIEDLSQYRQWRNKSIKLGLDLQGGMQVTIRVMPDDEMIEEVSNQIREIADPAERKQYAERAMGKLITDVRDSTYRRLYTRIDQYGVAEPSVTTVGNDLIVVQLPGLQDTERALEIMKFEGKLEFQVLDGEYNDVEAIRQGAVEYNPVTFDDERNIFLYNGEPIPDIPERRIVRYAQIKDANDITHSNWIVLNNEVDARVRSVELRRAEVENDEFGDYRLSFVLGSDSARQI